MMAFCYIPVFQQTDTNRFVVALEIQGMICKRMERVVRTFPEAMAFFDEAYRAMATPEMLEAQGMAEPAGYLGNTMIRQNAEEDRRAANQERMARVRAAKAAKHQKEATAC